MQLLAVAEGLPRLGKKNKIVLLQANATKELISICSEFETGPSIPLSCCVKNNVVVCGFKDCIEVFSLSINPPRMSKAKTVSTTAEESSSIRRICIVQNTAVFSPCTGQLQLLNLETFKLSNLIPAHKKEITFMDRSPRDEQVFATCSADGCCKIWTMRKQLLLATRSLRPLEVGQYSVRVVRYHPQKPFLYTAHVGSDVSGITEWNEDTFEATRVIRLKFVLTSLAVNQSLVIGDREGLVHMFDLKSLKKATTEKLHALPVSDISLNGTMKATVSFEGYISYGPARQKRQWTVNPITIITSILLLLSVIFLVLGGLFA
mmetsp:Transcript_870/g.1681  ORF Transcript_870/g.1681 Transcript_870/m.1681 type:complete len:319 (-) Transcript_870:1333-2289(-)